jgi:hypothetical protein
MGTPPRPDEPGWQVWAEEQTVRTLRAHLTERLAGTLARQAIAPAPESGDPADAPATIDLDDRVIHLPRIAPQASTG